MNSLISVIIPAYNHEKYVQETMQSIINQTYQNIELIVINDGSKDSTWQKINEMKELCENRFSRIVFETQENQGTCNTLNKLLEFATGEYVYLIASDDLAKPHSIKKQVEFLSKNPDYSLVVGDNEIIDENSTVAYWDENQNNVYDEKKAKYKTFGDFLKSTRPEINFNSKKFGTYSSFYIGNYVPNGYLIRKNVFNKTGYCKKEAPLEDFYLILQISKYAKLKYIDEVLFSYRWHSTNTIKNSERMIDFSHRTIANEINLIKNLDLTTLSKKTQAEIIEGYKHSAFGIPYILEFYKLRTFEFQKRVLKIFGIKFILKQRPLR